MKHRDPAKDYAWFLRQPENIARYAGQVVLLRHRTVLGSGPNYQQALEDARRRPAAENRPLPEDDFMVLSVQEPLGFDPDYFGGTPVRSQEG